LKKSKSSETLRFFQRFVAEEGVARSRFGNQKMESTSRPEHCGRMSKKCTPLWREARLEVYNIKFGVSGGTLLKLEIFKKVPAVVARSTFRSQNGQSTPPLEHFWKLRLTCSDIARRCAGKRVKTAF
jgi:hypothetical protein